jgi:hypothetical protein
MTISTAPSAALNNSTANGFDHCVPRCGSITMGVSRFLFSAARASSALSTVMDIHHAMLESTDVKIQDRKGSYRRFPRTSLPISPRSPTHHRYQPLERSSRSISVLLGGYRGGSIGSPRREALWQGIAGDHACFSRLGAVRRPVWTLQDGGRGAHRVVMLPGLTLPHASAATVFRPRSQSRTQWAARVAVAAPVVIADERHDESFSCR